jgi:enediyne polyketide synthase
VTIDDIDVANPADLRFALQRIEHSLGPVTAVAHAVGQGRSLPLAELTEEELRTQVSAETASLNDLVSGIMTRQIRLIITFGSVAGRYGLAGEGLLALASASLAERARRMAAAIPGCRAVHVDWPAWSGRGLGQRDSLVDGLARSGAAAIPVREGSRLLLKTLATPGLPGHVAVHGRVGVPAPAAIAAAAPSAGRGRFLENVRVHYPGVELVCEARLTLQTDPYLADHRVDGLPVLPAAMALEAMAQVAAVLAGQPLRVLTDVSMDAPVVIPPGTDDAQALIRICALTDGASVTARIQCEESGFATDHFRATFRSADDAAAVAAPSLAAGLPELDEMPASHTGIVDGTELYGPICFQSGRFRRAALLPEVTSRSCRALVRGGDGQPWFGDTADVTDAGLTLGSPGLNDATWHVLQACVPHRRILPAGCEAVMFSGREAEGAVEIRAVEIRPGETRPGETRPGETRVEPPRGVVPGPRPGSPVRPQPSALTVPRQGDAAAVTRPAQQAVEYVWDVEAVDAAGQSLVTWRGLRLRDAGPLPRHAAWPPSLLSVYLERRAVALGLHPELRVTVECGQPDGAGLAPAPVAVVPQPSPAPDRRPAAPGSGQLEGFSLSVRAPQAAACSWETAAGVPDNEPGPDLADVADKVRRLLREPAAVISARLRAVAACLSQAGAPPVSSVMADGTADTDWLVLTAAGSTLACTVVEISGVSCPVAIAIMTPDADRSEFRSPAQPGRRTPGTVGAEAQVPFR